METAKTQPEKLILSSKHALHAAAHLLQIKAKSGRMVPLVANQSQVRLFEAVYVQKAQRKPVRVIVWKGRQQGLSTGVAALNFLGMQAAPKSTLAITEEKGGSAQNLWDMYDRFDKGMPFELPCENTRLGHYRKYGNGSSIRVEGEKKISSFTHQQIHLSEAPFFTRLSATLEMVLQTVPDDEGTAIFLESAANEFGMQSQEDWQQEWLRAENGDSDFYPLFIPWFVHEEYKVSLTGREKEELANSLGRSEDARYGNEQAIYDAHDDVTYEALEWRRRTIRNKCGGSVHKFRRQYPNTPEEVMQASGLHVFDLGALKRMQKDTKPPIWKGNLLGGYQSGFQRVDDPSGGIWVWEAPEPGAEYVASSDHAEGLPSGDFNVGYIIRRMPLTVVARLRGHDGLRYSPGRFAEAMHMLLSYYNDPYYCPESNLDGGTVSEMIYNQFSYSNMVNEGLFGWHTPGSPQALRPGWRNTTRSRQLVLNYLVELIEQGDLIIYDERLLDEMRTMVKNRGKPEAVKKNETRKPGDPESGFYDDCVFAAAGAVFTDKHLPPPQPRSMNLPSLEERMVSHTLKPEEMRGLGLI